jgi:hypothetical protein
MIIVLSFMVPMGLCFVATRPQRRPGTRRLPTQEEVAWQSVRRVETS